MGYYRRIHREVRVMETKLENGCVVSVPENVSFVFASKIMGTGTKRIECVLCGDAGVLLYLAISIIRKIFKDLDEIQRIMLYMWIDELAANKWKEDNDD